VGEEGNGVLEVEHLAAKLVELGVDEDELIDGLHVCTYRTFLKSLNFYLHLPTHTKTQNRCDRWWLLEQQALLLVGDENGSAYVEVGGQGHVDGVDIWIVKEGLVWHRSFGRIGRISASAQREETGAYSEE
jgi:hypothetical protein